MGVNRGRRRGAGRLDDDILLIDLFRVLLWNKPRKSQSIEPVERASGEGSGVEDSYARKLVTPRRDYAASKTRGQKRGQKRRFFWQPLSQHVALYCKIVIGVCYPFGLTLPTSPDPAWRAPCPPC